MKNFFQGTNWKALFLCTAKRKVPVNSLQFASGAAYWIDFYSHAILPINPSLNQTGW